MAAADPQAGLTRRKFLVAAGACALPLSAAAQLPGPTNLAVRPAGPIWKTVPNLTFTKGVPGRIPISGYVSDAVRISLSGAALPAGVSFDGSAFVYDGVGGLGLASGVLLVADDGVPLN